MTSSLTRLLLAHRAAGTTIDSLPDDLVPADLAAAYRVQSETLEALGPVGAWKVSPVPESGEPACSPLPQTYLHRSGATLPRGAFHGLGIEVEIAFTLGEALPAGASAEDAREAIGSVHLALELIASRYTDRQAMARTAAFADLQSSGGIVLGEPHAFDAQVDLGSEALTLRFGGDEVAATQGGPSTDNALKALAWLATHAASRGTPLTRGTVVITGARLGPTPLSGDSAEARSPRFGSVAVAFQA